MTEKVDDLQELEKGEKVLFNDRKTPLEVTGKIDGGITVEGPSGGEYEIYEAEDTDDLLVSKKGNRRYSSYCKELRKVGSWERKDDTWTHSITGEKVELVKNSLGYWTIKSGLDTGFLDLPKYGYSDKEVAEEDALKLVKKNPEG